MLLFSLHPDSACLLDWLYKLKTTTTCAAFLSPSTGQIDTLLKLEMGPWVVEMMICPLSVLDGQKRNLRWSSALVAHPPSGCAFERLFWSLQLYRVVMVSHCGLSVTLKPFSVDLFFFIAPFCSVVYMEIPSDQHLYKSSKPAHLAPVITPQSEPDTCSHECW